MADIIDDAQELIEKQVELSLRAISLNTEHPTPVGTCLYCNDPVPHPKLYCDGLCADGHAYDMKRAKQNVRVG